MASIQSIAETAPASSPSSNWNLRAGCRVEHHIGSACAAPEEVGDEADCRVGPVWHRRGRRRRVGQEGGSGVWHRHDDVRQDGPAAGRLLPLRQRRVGRPDADPGRQGVLRQLRHPLRQDGARPARDRRRRRQGWRSARLGRAEDRRLLRELHGRGAGGGAWRHAARGGTGRDRRGRDEIRPRAGVRPPAQARVRRPARRHSPKATSRTRRPRRSSSIRAASACPTATTT